MFLFYLINLITLCMHTNLSVMCLQSCLHICMCPHARAHAIYTYANICGCPAICQMQSDMSHVPNLNGCPVLAASLINLMDL